MGFETRGKARYYYRKARQGARVVSKYVGRGEVARLVASMDRLDHERARAAVAERRARARAAVAAGRAAWGLVREAQQLAALAMLAAGYHRGHRGQWRKRRVQPMSDLAAQLVEQARAEQARRRAAAAELPPLPPPGDFSPAAAMAIMRRCDRVDAGAEDVEALRALLRERAAGSAESLTFMSGLARALATELDELPNALTRELRRAGVELRRRDLGYAEASALERPLIDHLVLCELRLNDAELRHTALWGAGGQGLTWADARSSESMLSSAQRRYLAAVEALARVRRVRVELARVLPDGTAQAVAVERPG